MEVYSISKAPQLVELKFVAGSNAGKFEATFDRPVDNLATTLVKIDGLALADKTFDLKGNANPGNYTYEVDIASGAEYNLASKVGKHEVVIFDVAETAVNNPAVNTTINTSYEVVADVTAPVVKGIEAVNANKFFVEFSEAVKLDAVKKNSITVKKGNLTFPTVDATTVTSHNSTNAETYVSGLEYRGGKPGVYVVVNATNATGTANPLYKDNESTVTLDVTVENFKDNVDLLGTKYNSTVTLSKGTATPKVEKSVVASVDKSLEVLFDEKLFGAPTATNLVVKDKDGVIVPTADVTSVTLEDAITNDTNTYTGQVVKIALATQYQDRAPYTVTFKEDAVKYAVDSSTIAGYSVEANGNKALDVTVGKASDSNAKYHAFNGSVALDSLLGKNVIKVDYGTEMDAATSRDIRNYTLDGKALPTGTKLDFYSDKKVVILTLPEETITRTTSYKFSINPAVKTEKGQSVVKDLQTLVAFDQTLVLTDNVRPTLAGAEYLVGSTNATTSDEIIVKFSENIANTASVIAGTDFSVIVNGNTIAVDHIQNGKAGDEYVIIKLAKEVNVSQAATISVKTDVVKDKNSVIEDTSTPALKLNASTVTASTKTLDAQGNASTVAAPGAPTPSKTNVSAVGTSDGTITGVTTSMEFKLASASAWTDVTATTITGLAAGKYEVRVKAGSSPGAPAGAIATVTVQNPVPTTPNFTGGTGNATGGTANAVYQVSTDGTTWTDVTADASGNLTLVAGTYSIKVKASTDGLTPESTAQANVTVN